MKLEMENMKRSKVDDKDTLSSLTSKLDEQFMKSNLISLKMDDHFKSLSQTLTSEMFPFPIALRELEHQLKELGTKNTSDILQAISQSSPIVTNSATHHPLSQTQLSLLEK